MSFGGSQRSQPRWFPWLLSRLFSCALFLVFESVRGKITSRGCVDPKNSGGPLAQLLERWELDERKHDGIVQGSRSSPSDRPFAVHPRRGRNRRDFCEAAPCAGALSNNWG